MKAMMPNVAGPAIQAKRLSSKGHSVFNFDCRRINRQNIPN